MKKLLFAAMAAAMASVASAATDWTYSAYGIKKGYEVGKGETSSTSIGAGYTVYFLFNKYDDSAGKKKLCEDVLAGFRSGKSIEETAGENFLCTATTDQNGKASTTADPLNDKFIDSGKTLSTIAVIAHGNILLASYNAPIFTSGDQTSVGNWCSSMGYRVDDDGTGAYSGDGWYAIPEPTSGLLLLIGMAGLVLKRKRA